VPAWALGGNKPSGEVHGYPLDLLDLYFEASVEGEPDIALLKARRPACHRLSMRTNCYTTRTVAHADWSGVVSPTMRVSSMTLAYAKAQVAFPPLNPSTLHGPSIHMIGIVS